MGRESRVKRKSETLTIRIPCHCGRLVKVDGYDLRYDKNQPVCAECAAGRTSKVMELSD